MNKLNIVFDIVDTWNIGLYRELINDFLVEDEFYNVFMVTQDPDTSYINKVTQQLDMDANNVYQEITDAAVISRLTTLQADIYLCADNELVESINNSINTKAILVNNIPNMYYAEPAYITSLKFWINELTKNDRKNTSIC